MSVGWGQDTTPPELTFFSIEPDTVNLNNRNPVISNMELFDETGIGNGFLRVTGPSGQIMTLSYTGNQEQIYNREFEISFSENSEQGIWVVDFFVTDIVGNTVHLSPSSFGFPSEIFVIYEEPSLCDEETEVELWDECYNIENTTFINFSYQEGSDYLPLSGGIPPEIGQLVNMTDLYLGGNELTDIPPEIGNLVNLQSLFLYDNQFTSIPSEIGNLTNLRTLDIGYNQITELPNELFSLSNLELLRLEYNELNTISNDLCNLSGCNIYINDNYICPPYPECLSEDDIGYQNTSECIECPELQGDINFDDIINVLDVVTLVTCIFSDDGCDICSDINNDGIVNILDVVILVNIILD